MARDNSPVTNAEHLPEGYSMRPFRPGEEEDWCRCCADGELGVAEISAAEFDRKMTSDDKVESRNIYFLVSPEEEIAGTVTYRHGASAKEGCVHMVGIVKSHRGKGLAAPMVNWAVREIIAGGNETICLSTDDWRLPAIKAYLNCGFEPCVSDEDTARRWEEVRLRLETGNRESS